MIDTAMLTRLMVLTGFSTQEITTPRVTKKMLALARAIWAEAQNDAREACAVHVEQYGRMAGLQGACKAMAVGIRDAL